MAENIKIFLSTVTAEFLPYRDELRHELTRPNVEVKVQEDFVDLGGDTLDKLDVYIAACDAVVHLVGDLTGSSPTEAERVALLEKHPDLVARLPALAAALNAGVSVSYTHWEAWLALYHDKLLFIAEADAAAPRAAGYKSPKPPWPWGLWTKSAPPAAQLEHLVRLRKFGKFPGCKFKGVDDLAKYVALSAILDLLAEAKNQQPARRPRNLPFASLGSLFKGREKIMADLRSALQSSAAAAVAGKALHGLGGVGKTRLAIEYAWAHADDYTALLFLAADTPEKLSASLAALAGQEILDLPEKDAPQDSVKIAAVLQWLETHPGWLMILDNIDDAKAAEAAEALLGRLQGGHVLIVIRIFRPPSRRWSSTLWRSRMRSPSCWREPRSAPRRLRTKASRANWRTTSAASPWASAKPRPISTGSASASPAIWRCGARRGKKC